MFAELKVKQTSHALQSYNMMATVTVTLMTVVVLMMSCDNVYLAKIKRPRQQTVPKTRLPKPTASSCVVYFAGLKQASH